MERLTTRASGFVATAAVHVGIAAVLLAGWQVTRPKPQPKPIIAIPIPAPNERVQISPPPSSEQPITAEITRPIWDEAAPEPVQPLPVGEGASGGQGTGGETVIGTPPPPTAAGPTRIARLIASTAVQPPYPSVSRALGEEGSVQLMVNIDEKGQVTGVSLVRTSGHARLDAAAITFALKRWRFEAALENGKPVATSRRFTIKFNLAESN